MKKWIQIILALLFVPLIALGTVAFTDKDETVSVLEKRALKTEPALTSASLFGGSYTKDFEEYFSDTFPLRDVFMAINRKLNRFYFFSGTDKDNVLVLSHSGDDLASGGESLDEVEQFMNQAENSAQPSAEPSPEPVSGSSSPAPEALPELDNPDQKDAFNAGHSIIIVGNRAMEIPNAVPKSMTRYAEAVNSIAKALPECRVFSLITPNAGEFYSPESFHTGSRSQKDMIEKTYAQMDGVITVDAYSAIRKHIDQYVYFRTDHHWTALGAYYAYTALCDSAGFEPVALDRFQTGRYKTFLGTMYGWTSEYPQSQVLKDDPDYLDYYLPVVKCSAEYFKTPDMTDGSKIPVVDTGISEDYSNKYLCFIRGDTPICRIVTENKNGKKIAVVKESFANALVPFLTSHYEEIYVIDPRKFNSKSFPVQFNLPSFAKTNGINDILVINYPFVINNKGFIAMIENLMK